MNKKKPNDLLVGLCNYSKSSRYDYEKTSVNFNSLKVGVEGNFKESR